MKDLRIEVEREYSREPGELFVAVVFRLFNGEELISETKVDPELFENESRGI
jgi:hypothetical protein